MSFMESNLPVRGSSQGSSEPRSRGALILSYPLAVMAGLLSLALFALLFLPSPVARAEHTENDDDSQLKWVFCGVFSRQVSVFTPEGRMYTLRKCLPDEYKPVLNTTQFYYTVLDRNASNYDADLDKCVKGELAKSALTQAKTEEVNSLEMRQYGSHEGDLVGVIDLDFEEVKSGSKDLCTYMYFEGDGVDPLYAAFNLPERQDDDGASSDDQDSTMTEVDSGEGDSDNTTALAAGAVAQAPPDSGAKVDALPKSGGVSTQQAVMVAGLLALGVTTSLSRRYCGGRHSFDSRRGYNSFL